MLQHAAAAIFAEFPDTFVLIGGAALILLHDSVRLSSDLDLLARNVPLPPAQSVADCLERELESTGEALGLGPFRFNISTVAAVEAKIAVADKSGRQLFRLDLTRFGSAIESQIIEHPAGVDENSPVTIKAASIHLLLLQKAEALLLRRGVRARDAYDIYVLKQRGAELNANLEAHLSDALRNNEIDSDLIHERIEYIGSPRFRAELSAILPARAFSLLERTQFEDLRRAVRELFAPWLGRKSS